MPYVRVENERNIRSVEVHKESGPDLHCPGCGRGNTLWSSDEHDIQRYWCQVCGYYFAMYQLDKTCNEARQVFCQLKESGYDPEKLEQEWRGVVSKPYEKSKMGPSPSLDSLQADPQVPQDNIEPMKAAPRDTKAMCNRFWVRTEDGYTFVEMLEKEIADAVEDAKRDTAITKIDNDFTYHAPKPGQPEKYEVLRTQAKDLALKINELCPDSKEKDMAMCRLNEAVMWAVASIARNE